MVFLLLGALPQLHIDLNFSLQEISNLNDIKDISGFSLKPPVTRM